MGLAVLPARLKDEMAELADALVMVQTYVQQKHLLPMQHGQKVSFRSMIRSQKTM